MREIVKTLKNSKSAGPNSIPTRILKINKYFANELFQMYAN